MITPFTQCYPTYRDQTIIRVLVDASSLPLQTCRRSQPLIELKEKGGFDDPQHTFNFEEFHRQCMEGIGADSMMLVRTWKAKIAILKRSGVTKKWDQVKEIKPIPP